MSIIPGLSVIPPSDLEDDGRKIELISFDLRSYYVPDIDRYGNCRLLSDFQKLCFVGDGATRIVYKVKDTKCNKIVALKKLRMPTQDDSLSPSVIREISILRTLKHENIVNMSGIAVGRTFESTYLIIEYCDFDLSKVLDDEKSCAMVHEPEIKYIMYQLFNGLMYIHDNEIIHRDLNPANIFFTSTAILKIGDFGTCCSENRSQMTPNVSCRWYRAPELLFGATQYTCAVDLWAAGCIFAELFLKNPLFRGDSDIQIIALIIDLIGVPTDLTWPDHKSLPLCRDYQLPYQPFNNLWKYFPYKSQLMLQLLNNILVYNPGRRYPAENCMEHDYFYQPPAACFPLDLLRVLQVSAELRG